MGANDRATVETNADPALTLAQAQPASPVVAGGQHGVDSPRPRPTEPWQKEKDVAFYGEIVNAWVATRMEKDKSLLTLAVAGLAGLVTYFTTVGPQSQGEFGLSAAALLGFVVSSVSIVSIFGANADYLAALAESSDAKEPRRLRWLDRLVMWSFVLGLCAAAALGAVTGMRKFTNSRELGGSAMTGKPTPANVPKQGTQPAQPVANTAVTGKEAVKSLTGLNNLRPNAGGTPSSAQQPGTVSSGDVGGGTSAGGGQK